MIKPLTIVLEAASVGEKIDLIRSIDKVQEAKKELEDQGTVRSLMSYYTYQSYACVQLEARKEDHWGKQIEERIEEAENKVNTTGVTIGGWIPSPATGRPAKHNSILLSLTRHKVNKQTRFLVGTSNQH